MAGEPANTDRIPFADRSGDFRSNSVITTQFVAVADHEQDCRTGDGGFFGHNSKRRSISGGLTQDCPVRLNELNVQGHLAAGVGRTTQARVEATDASFYAVEHRFGNVLPANVMARNLGDRLVHGQVVLAGGNDKIDLFD